MSIQEKMQLEYEQGYSTIESVIAEKEKVLEKLIPNVPDGEIRVHLLWKNHNLENALFSSDKMQMTFTSDEGRLGKYKADNLKKACEFDYEDQEMFYDDEDIRMHNSLYGASVRLPIGYDVENNQPISIVVSPLYCVPDPKNHRGSNMRFFGFRRKMTIEDMKSDPSYNVKEIKGLEVTRDLEIVKREQKQSNAKGEKYIFDQDGLLDVYDHWTIYNGKKYFTTWGANRTIELRKVELGALSRYEKSRPDKIDFGITIIRRKPKPFSFFGVSIADEVLQYQDTLSRLYNLKLINANLQAHGNDMLIDSALDIDEGVLANSVAGGRKIPVTIDPMMQKPLRDMVAEIPANGSMSQGVESMMQQLNTLSQDTIGVTDLSFANSPGGSQTKSEVQTLMKNANVLLANVGSNYARGLKEYWKSHVRKYALTMHKDSSKKITHYANGETEYLNLAKKDFIPEGKIQVHIESEKEVKAEKDKDFAKITASMNLFIANVPQGGIESKRLLRKYGNLLTVKGFNVEDIITLTKDERIAHENLTLLNNDIEIDDPEIGQDYEVLLFIYKQAIDTPAKRKAVKMYEQAIEYEAPLPQEEMGQQDGAMSGIAGSLVSAEMSESNQNISLADLT